MGLFGFGKKKEEERKANACCSASEVRESACCSASEVRESACCCGSASDASESNACCCGSGAGESCCSASGSGEGAACCDVTIKVLGAGCKSCHEQYENAKAAVQAMGLHAAVEYITDMEQVMAYGAMRMPAIVVNEQLVSMGKVLKPAEVEQLLRKLGC